ncbi:MAG: hypothetical protein RAO94_08200 [Candidatus Stygibacter australis]|nr:hypothetical protein [Candidatus Stygibacter australis]MDP8322318.1 hypothetical protein [Candidatus Stygibacter australis]
MSKLLGNQGGYRKMMSFQMAQLVYDVADWIIKNRPDKKQYPEYSANAVLVLIKVACALLNTHVEGLADDFE